MDLEILGGEIRSAPLNENFALVQERIESFAVNVLDFGAVGDWDDSTQSGTDDHAAFQAALDTGLSVYVPAGRYRVHEKELLMLTSGQRLIGAGGGASHGPRPDIDHVGVTDIVFTGQGESYLKTRRQPRETSGDPNDQPLSTAINVQAEGVSIERLCLRLHVDYDDPDPGNLGDAWDVGIFNGCRTQMRLRDVRVFGYWRVASIYIDVTRGARLPEFSPPGGQPFPVGSFPSGADQCLFEQVYCKGGLKGLFIAGAIETPTGDYYDEVSQTVYDLNGDRGTAGASDFHAVDSTFFARDHHSEQRAYDPVSPLNFDHEDIDQLAGCAVIDGRRGFSQNRIRRFIFTNCRFRSFEAVRVGLGRAYEVRFYGIHTESSPAAQVTDTQGNPITHGDTSEHNYGAIAAQSTGEAGSLNPGTDRVFVDGINSGPTSAHFQSKLGRFANTGSASTAKSELFHLEVMHQMNFPGNGSLTRDSNGNLVARSSLVNRPDGSAFLIISDGDAALDAGNFAHLRVDGRSRIQCTSTVNLLHQTTRPAVDDEVDLGSSDRRWREIFASNDVINTSDATEKEAQGALSEREVSALNRISFTKFRWKKSVEERGDQARIHFGVLAQDAVEAFQAEGLDPWRYACFCRDEVLEEDDDGAMVGTGRFRYGIRYGELLAMKLVASLGI